jgi:NAD(P)-dependent dehydrogenase (short-subunit alcohol dehydrogenase family)
MVDAMRTNFVGVLNVTNAVLPHMRNRRDGLIVFMGSRSVFRNQIIVSLCERFAVISSHTPISMPQGLGS